MSLFLSAIESNVECNHAGRLHVMWYRYFINSLSAAQYLTYLLVGALYFSVVGAMARVTTGTSFIALGAVFVPLLLGGYVSGLSLVMPRVAAVVAFACSIPYLSLGIFGFRITAQQNSVFVIPSVVIIAVSVVAFLWSEGSVWLRLTNRFAKLRSSRSRSGRR